MKRNLTRIRLQFRPSDPGHYTMMQLLKRFLSIGNGERRGNLGIIGIKWWFMSKLEMIALSGVVYRVKSTGPSTEPCGTPYESVTSSVNNCHCLWFDTSSIATSQLSQLLILNSKH